MSGDTRSRIAALSPTQRSRLEARLATAKSEAHETIAPRDRTRPTPLGVAQQREWAVSRLRGVNNVPSAFRVHGEVDLDILADTLTGIIVRHEILRTTVDVGADGVPVQNVGPDTPVTIRVVDLSLARTEDQPDLLREACKAEIGTPFGPRQQQRVRMTMIKLAAEDHVGLLVTDHASADAWSLALLIKEIAAGYSQRASSNQYEPRVAATAAGLQFGDFAVWQRRRDTVERRTAEVEHWRGVLQGISVAPSLPSDRQPPVNPTYAGEIFSADLGRSLVSEIGDYSEKHQASLFSILLATMSVLLYRHLDDEDLVIGSLVSGRTRGETENMVGCFANPLPLRIRVQGEHTLRQVVDLARATLAGALDHQDVPFDRLAGELGLARASTKNSFSRVWINVITVPVGSIELPDLRFETADLDLGLASVDLTLSALPEADRLRLNWQYMTEVFDHATVSLLSDQFVTVLQQVIEAPDLIVDRVGLDAEDLQQTYRLTCVLDPLTAIGHRADLAPHAVAVADASDTLTYAELVHDAANLAGRLRASGVGRGSRVGVLVGGLALAPTVLGALSVGATVQLMDTSTPPEQAVAELARSAVNALIVTDPAIAPGRRVHVIEIDRPTVSTEETMRAAAPGINVASAREVASELGIGAGDRICWWADPAVSEPTGSTAVSRAPGGAPIVVSPAECGLVATWIAGGVVVLAVPSPVEPPEAVTHLLRTNRVSVLVLPITWWRLWRVALGRNSLPPDLRLVIVEQEPAQEELLAWERVHDVPVRVLPV